MATNDNSELFHDLFHALNRLTGTLVRHGIRKDVVVTLASREDGVKIVGGLPRDYVTVADDPSEYPREAKLLGVVIRWP